VCAGKTRLGVALSKALGGEVVSADSMQVYRELSIASAKVTREEADGVVHHLVDEASCTEEFDARRFQRLASARVREVAARGRVPVVVGGTFLYVEALLWRSFINQGEAEDDERKAQARAAAAPPPGSAEASRLYAELQRVDPVMANRLHPNDVRRVSRSLEVFQQTGRPHSAQLIEAGGVPGRMGAPEFPCIFLWLDCEQREQDLRLDARVDEMMRRGLLEECRGVLAALRRAGQSPAAKGVMQSIGVKEMLPLLEAEEAAATAGGAPLEPGRREELLAECVSALKAATRRYARRQLKWIRGRFAVNCVGDSALRMYRLDTTNAALFEQQVVAPALSIARDFLSGRPPPPEEFARFSQRLPPLREPRPKAAVDEWRKHTCDACRRTLNGDHELAVHLRSRGHKNAVLRRERAGRRVRDAGPASEAQGSGSKRHRGTIEGQAPGNAHSALREQASPSPPPPA
jgi:tRNA dimethylallyltransferase